MLRSIILVTALALGGCATSSTSTTDINSTIAAVQSAAVTACKFLPTVSTVANLLTTGNAGGIAQTAESIAALICQAVAPAAVSSKLRDKLRVTSPTSSPITVNGVVIHGRFVS